MISETDKNGKPTLRRTVFLDRDGTVICEKDFLGDPEGVELLPHAAEAIAQLNSNGYLVIIISNQSGVARGYYDEHAVQRVNKRIVNDLAEAGARIDGIYYCPHLAEGTVPEYRVACECRKPRPGMGHKAINDFPIDSQNMVMIGDRAADIEFGKNLGCRTILVTTGYGRRERERIDDEGLAAPDYIASDLAEAVTWLLKPYADPGI